ncbi:hypothetical protein [Devosia sp. RR2S18]|uniref:hypothetical protein n=1 Tax=Devosia rhizosphaerae TaxID=3049774 RepID=UPI0025426183|nr:hypothetical protein [Devosia sp. RR2S18]WIJ26779.1 hypothetical protein QOV41_08525 [Devosia sp. RR2S18]
MRKLAKSLSIAAMATLLGTASSWAGCPAAVPATTAEAIAANQQRLLCLQLEANAAAAARDQSLQLRALQMDIKRLELQQRFNNLQRLNPP